MRFATLVAKALGTPLLGSVSISALFGGLCPWA